MKIKNCVCTIITVMLLFSSFAMAANKLKLSPKVAKMVKYAQQNQVNEASKLLKDFNKKETNEFVNYLESNPGSLPPVYFVIIADYVYNKDKDKAVFFYNFGKIRAMEDVRMCKDTSARQQTYMYGWMAPETIKYMKSKGTDAEYIDAIYKKIFEWDSKYTDRVSPIWSCYHGIQAFSGKPELLPDSEFPKIQAELQNEYKNIGQKIKELNQR